MKIKVKDLEANPYRNIGKYPIDRAKVEALKISIKETTFWDNILVRPSSNKGKYQIAYGHHRHIAIKECGLKEIDVPCRELSNAQMVKIMAEENLGWNTSPAVVNETVLATKLFLESAIKDTPCLGRADKSISSLWADEVSFKKAKTDKMVGREIILKFLGKNWESKGWMIQGALDTIKIDKLSVEEGGVSREAIETLPTIEAANKFRNEAKRHKIPKPTQKRIAKKIVDDGIGTRDIAETIREIAKPEHLDREPKKKVMPTLDKFVGNLTTSVRNVHHDLIKIKPNIGDIQSSTVRRQLLRECVDLSEVLTEIIVKENRNVKKTG